MLSKHVGIKKLKLIPYFDKNKKGYGMNYDISSVLIYLSFWGNTT